VTLPACAGRQAKFGRGDAKEDLVTPFGQAVEAEQIRGPEAALTAYLALLDRALANSAASARRRSGARIDRRAGDPNGAEPRTHRHDHALAYRHPGAMKTVAEHLARDYEAAAYAGPFARGVIAGAALELALHDGNAPLAQTWRQRTGCARTATVVGPLDWAPITAVAKETPLEAPGPLAASYKGVGPFVDKIPR